MPDPSLIAVVAIVAIVAAWQPERTVMALGVFLFVQSAIVRVDLIPEGVRIAMGRLDELVVIALAARFAFAGVLARKIAWPKALWAAMAFAGVGLVSIAVNGVPLIAGTVGLFLALKGALWLFVAAQLRYESVAIMRYAAILAALFAAAIGVAVVQFMGVTLPWDPLVRRSGELAATSIWNQHTVFGSALALSAGVAVIFVRLPRWRNYGVLLVVASAGGAILSTARRVFLSVPLAVGTLLLVLPHSERTRRVRSAWAFLSQRRVLVTLGVVVIVVLAIVGPRMFRIAGDTWDEYVVNAATRDRYELYRGGIDLAVRSPAVGRGPGTFGSYASVLFNSPAYAELGIRLPDSLKMGAPYASLLGEFGILGVVAFGAFITLTVRALLPAVRSANTTIARALASAAFVIVVDMALESAVHVTFSDSLGSFIAFGSAGAALRLWGTTGEESAPAPEPEPRWILGSLVAASMLMLSLIVVVGWLARSAPS